MLLYTATLPDETAEVWVEESAKVKFYYWMMDWNLKCHFDWSELEGYGGIIVVGFNDRSQQPYAVCERSGILAELRDGVSGRGTLDLNGFDQSVPYLNNVYGNQTYRLTIKSDSPAVFTVASYRNDSANYPNSTTRFSGKVDVTYTPKSAAGVYRLNGSKALSDSCGKLSVASGALTFAGGAG